MLLSLKNKNEEKISTFFHTIWELELMYMNSVYYAIVLAYILKNAWKLATCIWTIQNT